MNKLTALIAMFMCSMILSAQPPAPGKMLKGRVLVKNGILHVGNGRKYDSGAVVFKDGLITYAGPAVNAPEVNYDRKIDAGNGHIYPGFIALNTTLGLQEIGAVRATRDKRENGKFTPHVRSIVAYNAESMIIPTVRFNGVLLAQVVPRGGVISGRSSVVQLDAWNWEDAVVAMDSGLHVYWPHLYGWKSKKGRLVPKENKHYSKKLEKLDKLFTRAAVYNKADTQRVRNMRMEALSGIINGSCKLYVHAQGIKQIREAVQFKSRHHIKDMVLVGGRDAKLAAGTLSDNNIPVIASRVHHLPPHSHSRIDYYYALPGLLKAEGLTVGLDIAGMMAETNVRNIPFYAGTAAHYGLEGEEALQALTLDAAKILGIDSVYGTLEKGKSATLFISKGNALEIRGSNVTHAYIDGREITLKGRQQRLYSKFKKKIHEQ